MQFIWDDPNTEGATQDGSGETFTIEFDRPGKYTVNLTVIDDDGSTDTASVIVTVEAKPSEGLFGIGMSTPSVIGGIFGIVIIVLLGVLLLRRGESDTVPIETANMSDYGWNESPPSVVDSVPVSEPVAAPMGIQEPVNTGPPIPASGLPEGWTMEQWAYYGEQYLAANQPPAPVAQPTPSMTPTTQDTNSLSSLLDDLDL